MFRLIVDVAGYIALFAFFLFLPAGTLHWWRAWLLLVLLFIVRIVSTISIARVNRGVLIERSKLPIHSGQPLADKILLFSFMASFAGMVAFASLDVFRFHLLPAPPMIVSSTGIVLFLWGWWIITVVLRTNAFAATVVRHQKERRHTVVTTGIYSIIRHPMYAGLIPVLVGLDLWLESYAAALVAMVPIGILVVRIHLEERFLKRELEGYEAYAAKVRRRLIPGIW